MNSHNLLDFDNLKEIDIFYVDRFYKKGYFRGSLINFTKFKMDDKFWSIFNEYLGEEEIKTVIYSRMDIILELILPKIKIDLENAIEEKNDSRIKELSSKQALLKKRMNFNSDTLLHATAENGSVEFAFRLLQFGASVDVNNFEGMTPMFYAIKNSEEMVQVLLKDSKVNVWSLFRHALLYGTEKIVKILLNKTLFEIQNDSGQDGISTVTCKFEEFSNTKLWINTFLKHELHLLNMEDSYPSLIFFAAKFCKKDILQIILDDCKKNLANIEQKKIENNRKLEYEPRVPKELNVQGWYGASALHLAVVHQLVDVARFLLEEGADPNCQDDSKFTPLHFAVFFEHEEMCQLLISFGANVSPNFSYPENQLNLVCGGHRIKIYVHLKNRYFRNDSIKFKNDCIVNLKIMKLLLNNGANPDSQTLWGIPVLLRTCEHGRSKEVKILLEYGANIHTVDSHGDSALHYAARADIPVTVDFLLEKGFDINLKNNNNENPLMAAIINRECSVYSAECLVDRGLNINAIDDFGETALHMAITKFSLDVECLLELGADWLILNIGDARISDYALSVGRQQKVLISFIALRENKLSNHIKFYVGNTDENLRDAFDYFEQSKLEMTELRTRTVAKDFRTSYLDFLTKDFYTSVQIAKNKDLRVFLVSDKYEEEFPCYQKLLRYRFRMVQNLEVFVEKTFRFILNYTNLYPEIVEMIMSNLRTTDFRVFGRILTNRRFSYCFKN